MARRIPPPHSQRPNGPDCDPCVAGQLGRSATVAGRWRRTSRRCVTPLPPATTSHALPWRLATSPPCQSPGAPNTPGAPRSGLIPGIGAVLRALRELRDEGLLTFRRGLGVRVSGTPERGLVLSQARELLRLARRHGYDTDELVRMIRSLG